jgi:hypothetical protein
MEVIFMRIQGEVDTLTIIDDKINIVNRKKHKSIDINIKDILLIRLTKTFGTPQISICYKINNKQKFKVSNYSKLEHSMFELFINEVKNIHAIFKEKQLIEKIAKERLEREKNGIEQERIETLINERVIELKNNL